MKYMPLDLSMMKPEPFPYPMIMRSDLHPKRQPSHGEEWCGRPGAVRSALHTLVLSCREKAGQWKMVKTVLSVVGACAFGLLAVGVFWLAVEMDNSDLQAARSSCSVKP